MPKGQLTDTLLQKIQASQYMDTESCFKAGEAASLQTCHEIYQELSDLKDTGI